MLQDDLKRALQLANEMEKKGIIGKYAIGGAFGAIYWTEPFATKDLDLFLQVPVSSGGLLLMPFLNYLAEKGYPFKAQHIQIGTLLVDFVAVYDPLTEEALDEAVETEVYGVPTRVFSAEHLLAIALKTGRPQDLAKADKLYRETDLREKYLENILRRHKLWRKWHVFKKRYLSTGG